MQSYIFTLLCLASLVSMVSFDAVNARKRSVYARMVENSENLFTAQRSACAEVEYQEKAKKISAVEKISRDAETSSPKKIAKVATTKKRKYRLLKVPFSRPPNNSRFNLYALLQESPEDYADSVSWHALFIRLLRRVYVDTGCVPPGSEYAVTKALLNKKEEILQGGKKFGADVIETLTLPSQEAEILYTMLRGTKTIQPLLNFLHYEEKPQGMIKLNLIFADPLLLEAIIDHPVAYRELEALRGGIWESVKRQEQSIQEHGEAAALELFKTRTDFRMELRDKTQILLSQYDLLPLLNKKIFDFTLGNAGDYLYLIDPETGAVSRCRCSPKSNKL
ncbi:hypothetical protein [Chlamydia psittaci]|uniref:hypothetical protein n=1 Tax=Chlamydia psittaci TaxID=83554 RepID=UPI00027E4ECB|nr:hypothetical protein [Chlamydia psittaci]EPJ25352.1 hypothetical protein CP09DC77_0338 [Chlamydia psittaci 09DC77]EPJ30677.1 hypothetical protein CP09DC78_0335 [Chlamydia psittaci 09DC78]EPL02089.1 hypothetical protein CP09DC79_0065 [Chlamydia psittaci 09DC79]AFS27456.1 hypothetical protein B711_1076 [Chlamydia psittaci CP3]EPJ26762.1 hypothetical protein CP09DC80_0335 [Chlamydia psittaci 09DC80]